MSSQLTGKFLYLLKFPSDITPKFENEKKKIKNLSYVTNLFKNITIISMKLTRGLGKNACYSDWGTY